MIIRSDWSGNCMVHSALRFALSVALAGLKHLPEESVQMRCGFIERIV